MQSFVSESPQRVIYSAVPSASLVTSDLAAVPDWVTRGMIVQVEQHHAVDS